MQGTSCVMAIDCITKTCIYHIIWFKIYIKIIKIDANSTSWKCEACPSLPSCDACKSYTQCSKCVSDAFLDEDKNKCSLSNYC